MQLALEAFPGAKVAEVRSVAEGETDDDVGALPDDFGFDTDYFDPNDFDPDWFDPENTDEDYI